MTILNRFSIRIKVGNTEFKEIEFDFEPLDQQTMKTRVIDEH